MTTHYKHWELLRNQKLQQITYVVTGVIAYSIFAVLFQKLRRKTCLYLVCASQLTACVVLLFANAFWLLHISRVFAAISCVGAGMMCVIYVSEIAPDDIRGGLVAIHKLLYSVTEIVPYIIFLSGIPIKSSHFAVASILISVAVAICAFISVPESPIYFLRLDDTAGAKHALKSMRGDETYVSQEISKKKHILKVTHSDNQTTTSVYQEFTKRRTVMFMCVAILLYLTRIFAGFMVTRLEVDAILWSIPKNAILFNAHFLVIGISLMILGSLLAVVLCDHVGRKILILVSSCLSSMCLMAFAICYRMLEHHQQIADIIRTVMFVISLVYVFCFNLGINTLPEVLTTDIFPPKILNTQVAILGSLQLCMNFLVHYVIYNEYVNIVVLVWLLAALSFAAAILFLKFLPETKRRPPGFVLVGNEESVLFSNLQERDDDQY